METEMNDYKCEASRDIENDFIQWANSLTEESFEDFELAELVSLIKDLVGESLDMAPHKVTPLYMNRACLINQIRIEANSLAQRYKARQLKQRMDVLLENFKIDMELA